MFSTFVFAIIFLGMFVTSGLLWAFFLWLGLLWANVSCVNIRGVVLTASLALTLQLAINLWIQFSLPQEFAESSAGVIAQIIVAIILQLTIIGMVFRPSVLQIVQSWLLTVLASLATVIIAVLIVRPALYDALTVSTNAMAPTLVGVHVQSICLECNQTDYGSPIQDRMDSTEPQRMICESYHVGPAQRVERVTFPGDRVLVAKFLKPRRWDIVVFHFPAKPEILDAKRIVGLPGETIQIIDGSIWADGEKLNPPAYIANLKYLDGIPELPQVTMWGAANRPALLAENEYFVLGDFSVQSADSRVWENGAPTHNPYAVPESHIVGVITHTFWPLDRARIHR